MRVATSYKQPNSANPCILSANGKTVRIMKNVTDSEKLEQLENFKQRAEQAAHDIRTPLTILSMALNHSLKGLSAEEYALLRNVTNSIKKIANVLLDPSIENEDNASKENSDDYQHIQVSEVLTEIVKQKKLQYIEKNVEFKYSFDSSVGSTFIYGNALNFERMMSNIINNSVEAFECKQGIVKVSFTTENEDVKILIEDNGKGISPEAVEKLNKGESVSTTKQNGHGIGTQQIRDALRGFCGSQLIESTINIGTKITLTIPKSDKPKNFVESDTVISEENSKEKACDNSLADVVLLDDSPSFVDTLSAFLESNGANKVDTYCHPNDLLKNLSKYSLDTKIFMDNDFKCDISGEDLAKQLTDQGFKNLHILSGSPANGLRSKYSENVKFIEKGAEIFMDDLIYYATRRDSY